MAVNVSQKYKEVIYSGGAINRATLSINGVQIPNSNIKKITISSPIIDSTVDYFYIGTFIAQKVEIEFRNATSIDLNGNVLLSIDTKTDDDEYADENGYENVDIGEFIIDTSPEEYSKSAKITCYDKSILFKPNVDIREFFDDEDKVTAEDLLKGLCNKFLGANKLGTYPNTNKNVTAKIYDTSKSGKYYISKIAEIMGCNAKIGRDGKLYLLPLKRQSTETINALKSKSWEFSTNYKISRVFWQVGNTIYDAGDETYNSLNITADNIFLYGSDNDIQLAVDNLYDELEGFEMCSVKTENYGDPSLDCWDLITYTLGDNTYYALNDNVLVYEMNIASTVNPSIPSKQREDITNVFGDANRQTNMLKTEVIQNEREIRLLADKIVDVSDIVTGTGSIQLENAYEGQLYQLSIKGNISLLYPQNEKLYGYPLVPHDGLVPSNTLVPSNPVPYDNEVHYPSSDLFTKNTILTIDDVEYKLDFNFLNYMNSTVCDEFVYDNGKCYIIRRVGIDENGDMYALDNEIIEPRESITLNVKSNSTITLNSFNDAILTANYLLDNAYTQNFATQVNVSTEIEQTADSILGQVVKDNEVVAKMNLALEDGQGIVRFVSNQFVVDSDNFKVSSDGTITANAGVIGGFHISNNFNNNFNGLYDYSYYDLMTLIGGFLDFINLDSTTFNILDIDENGEIDSSDLSAIQLHILGTYPISRSFSGKVEINSDDPKNCFTIKDINDNNVVQIGLGGVGANNGIFRNIVCSDNYSTSATDAVYINGVSGSIHASGTIHATGGYTQGSKVELKKNIEKFDNALEEIKNTDIYKYNYKTEEDGSKKHIGFIIGDDYKHSEEITSVDKEGNSNGVDLYSFISVCCQAIKEQQNLIDNLQQRIEALEKKESDK